MNIDEQFWQVDDWHEYAESEQTVDAAVEIMLEEVQELRDAKKADDLVEIADALGDILVTVYGVIRATQLDAAEYNLPLDDIFSEIMDSNFSKFVLGGDGKKTALFREDGKILKGPDYFRPNLASILGADDGNG